MSVNQPAEKGTVRRFNAIDVFIIVLVILCIVGVYFRSQIAQWIGIEKNLEEYTVSFEISEIRYTSSKYLSSGNKVYIDGTDIYVGEISGNCTFMPAEVYIENDDGDLVRVNYPKDTYIDVEGNIKCLGFEKDDGFYLNGTYTIAPGSTLKVYTEMMNFSIVITKITK